MSRQLLAALAWFAIYVPGRLIGKAFGIDPSFGEAGLMIIIVTLAVVAQCAILFGRKS